MTVLCGGGTSSAKAGFGASVAFTASGIAALLNNIPTPWAVGLAAYIGLITYDLASFCSTDPPPIPNLSAPDWINVVSIADPVAHLLAVQKMQQLVGAFAWCSLCQCDNGTIPNCGPPPAAPASLPTLNPPAVIGPNPNNVPCQEFANPHFVATLLNTSIQFGTSTAQALVPPVTAPAQSTLAVAKVSWTGTSPPSGWQLLSNTTGSNTTFTTRASDTSAWVSGATKTLSFAAASLDPFWEIQISESGQNDTFTFDLQFFCGGATAAAPMPNCGCVPDANTIGLLSSIYQTLTTIQRFKFPFAYILGAVHTNVSGTGATAISRLIGVQLTVTAQPATKRTSLGNPSYIYDLGWVSVSDADGMIEEKRLTRTNMLWFPQLGQLATSFNYFLQSGVTINWTEVQAEPGVTAA